MKIVVSTLTYEKNIDSDGSPDQLVFYIGDSMSLDRYLELKNTHGIPDILISDHPIYPEFPDNTQWIYLPAWLYQFIKTEKGLLQINDSTTEHCCNFMINKKQINRYLLLKLTEWFDLKSISYTWSGIGASHDCSRLLPDFDRLKTVSNLDVGGFKRCILSPVTKIETRFVKPESPHGQDYNRADSHIRDYGGNTWAWNHVLGEIFSKSAVSLITESVAYEKTIMFTEKTVYATMGLTFPIWIGGYQQADQWAQLGFDVFDDIINHDYQHYDSLLERCFYAIHDNIGILSDLDLSAQLKRQHRSRLQKNRDLLFPNLHRTYTRSLNFLEPCVRQFATNALAQWCFFHK